MQAIFLDFFIRKAQLSFCPKNANYLLKSPHFPLNPPSDPKQISLYSASF
jgi:hypothetical protein